MKAKKYTPPAAVYVVQGEDGGAPLCASWVRSHAVAYARGLNNAKGRRFVVRKYVSAPMKSKERTRK